MVQALGSLFSPIAALAVNMAIQIIAFRRRQGSHFFRSVIEGFFAGGLAVLLIEIVLIVRGRTLGYEPIVPILVNLPTYFALSYCYYSFVQLGQTSIRIRMYSEIASQRAGVTLAQMEREYDEHALTHVRLQRLLESGDIIERSGRYLIGRKRLQFVANIIFAAKHILLGKKSEFE